MKKPTPPKPEPKPPCCSNPSPLIPIVIIAALFILAVVLGGILFQQEKIATQRQQLQACTNHIAELQTALDVAKCKMIGLRLSDQNNTSFIVVSNCVWITNDSFFVKITSPYQFTNTPMEYPPRFLLKD